MPPLPTADWLAALDRMDAALAAARADLDAYEARWPDAPPAEPAPVRDAVPASWADRLAAAGRLAEELERDLTAQAAAADRWRSAFTAWRGGIQQPPDPRP